MSSMKKARWFFGPALLLAAVGCTKRDIDIQGQWEIVSVDSFDAGGSIAALCRPGGSAVLELSGIVEREFYGNVDVLDAKRKYPIPLVYGDVSENTFNTNTQRFECRDVTLTIRQHRDITITGQPYRMNVSQDPSGRCILSIPNDEQRSRPNITVEARLKGNGTIHYDDGTSESDSDRRYAGVTYDCDEGRTKAIWRERDGKAQPADPASSRREAAGIRPIRH